MINSEIEDRVKMINSEIECIKLVADILVVKYGERLKDFNRDVKMAEAVISELKGVGVMVPLNRNHSLKQYLSWKRERKYY